MNRDNSIRTDRKRRLSGCRAILIGFLGVLLLVGLSRVSEAQVGSETKMRRVSGVISWIDVKLGKLQLKADEGQKTKGITEYRINQNETRVTDPSDTKFLVIKDLRAGQHVTIELIDSHGETMARKIIADPMPEPVYQEATGELEAVDFQAGTLVIEQKPLPDEKGTGDLFYFVFDPKNIVVRKTPNMQPLQSELKPGDLVQVEYAVKDGKRHARSITLLSAGPDTTSTTTTTTTSTTVTR